MPTRMNVNISLTPKFMHMVLERLADGRYESASEVICAGLRLLDERDRAGDTSGASAHRRVAEDRAKLRAGTRNGTRGQLQTHSRSKQVTGPRR